MSSVFTEQSRNDYVPPEVKVRVHPEILESVEDTTVGDTTQSKENKTLLKLKKALRRAYFVLQAYYPMFQPYIAELIGTFIFVFLGIGSVSAIVLIGALKGMWEMGIVWGLSLAMSIYATASVSGAHLNPAISLTMAFFKGRTGFTWKRCGLYIVAQFFGGFVAGAVNLSIWTGFVAEFERQNGIVRGAPGSERSAMILTDFFPNPGFFPQYFPLGSGTDNQVTTSSTNIVDAPPIFSRWLAFSVETFGTGILSFMAFAVTDPSNKSIQRKELAPLIIGLTLTILICIFAPLTQACFNPARDLGPRLIAVLAGWSDIALAGKSSWIYVIAPLIGGPIGGFIYLFGLERRLAVDEEALVD
ncbi:hypothetical protein HDU97_004540 [Phlyctochytrium planicorne]|nr:hypothetical protein HDU97_004540 [Phlyctochytrium planicorne]